jgi:hypothetical protein
VLALSACGGASHKGHTITFSGGGAFPPTTIVGRYSAQGCMVDAKTLVDDARLYYAHSTTLPGPADLYYDDMRLDAAHFEADACTTDELADATKSLSARERRFLLHNLGGDLDRVFRAALSSDS